MRAKKYLKKYFYIIQMEDFFTQPVEFLVESDKSLDLIFDFIRLHIGDFTLSTAFTLEKYECYVIKEHDILVTRCGGHMLNTNVARRNKYYIERPETLYYDKYYGICLHNISQLTFNIIAGKDSENINYNPSVDFTARAPTPRQILYFKDWLDNRYLIAEQNMVSSAFHATFNEGSLVSTMLGIIYQNVEQAKNSK